jgi:hypothetical protein
MVISTTTAARVRRLMLVVVVPISASFGSGPKRREIAANHGVTTVTISPPPGPVNTVRLRSSRTRHPRQQRKHTVTLVPGMMCRGVNGPLSADGTSQNISRPVCAGPDESGTPTDAYPQAGALKK